MAHMYPRTLFEPDLKSDAEGTPFLAGFNAGLNARAGPRDVGADRLSAANRTRWLSFVTTRRPKAGA